MDDFLKDEEISDLILKAKAGNNDAWEAICENFDRYVHERAWMRIRKLDMSDSYRKEIEEDLYMAGWTNNYEWNLVCNRCRSR